MCFTRFIGGYLDINTFMYGSLRPTSMVHHKIEYVVHLDPVPIPCPLDIRVPGEEAPLHPEIQECLRNFGLP